MNATLAKKMIRKRSLNEKGNYDDRSPERRKQDAKIEAAYDIKDLSQEKEYELIATIKNGAELNGEDVIFLDMSADAATTELLCYHKKGIRITCTSVMKQENLIGGFEDILQQGDLLLLKTAMKFDLASGYRFNTFLEGVLRKEIPELIQKELGSPSGMKGITPEERKNLEIISPDQPVSDESKVTLIETIEAPRTKMVDEEAKVRMKQQVCNHLKEVCDNKQEYELFMKFLAGNIGSGKFDTEWAKLFKKTPERGAARRSEIEETISKTVLGDFDQAK